MISRAARMHAAQVASRVLADFGAKERVRAGYTRIDPIAIAEAAGLFVMMRPLERLVGAFLREEPRSGVLLNSARPVGLMHMTCAHELGHYFLDHETTADVNLNYDDNSRDIEQAADQFAYSLMTPPWLVAHVIKQYGWASRLGDSEVIYQLSLRLGLSYEATVRALYQQKKISSLERNQLLAVEPISIKRRIVPPGVKVSGRQDVWMLTKADEGSVIEPRDEDLVFVVLPSHASAGFLWSIGDSSQSLSLKPMPVARVQRTEDIQHLIVGGTARAVYQLHSNGEGAREPIRFKLTEQQPWSGRRSQRDDVSLATQYDEVEDGLSEQSIMLRLQEYGS